MSWVWSDWHDQSRSEPWPKKLGAEASWARMLHEESESLSMSGLRRAMPVGIVGYVALGEERVGPDSSELGGRVVIVGLG